MASQNSGLRSVPVQLDTTTEVAAGILPASEGGFQPRGYNAYASVAPCAPRFGVR